MKRVYTRISQLSGLEAFFRTWLMAAVGLAAYIIAASALVSDIGTALWLIGAPIAFAKAALVTSGLAILVWFVALRRS